MVKLRGIGPFNPFFFAWSYGGRSDDLASCTNGACYGIKMERQRSQPTWDIFLGRAGETGEQVITLITLRNLRPGKLPLARDGSCRTKLYNPCPPTTALHIGFFVFYHRTARRRVVSCIHIYASSSLFPSVSRFYFSRAQAPCLDFTRAEPPRSREVAVALCPSCEISSRCVRCCASASGVRFFLDRKGR